MSTRGAGIVISSWRKRNQTVETNRKIREENTRLYQEYLEKGGQIQQIPIGVVANPEFVTTTMKQRMKSQTKGL